MAELVTIGQLSALIEDQYRLLGWLEDNAAAVPPFDPVFPERNQIEFSLGGEPWSLTVLRHGGYECVHRDQGRLVILRGDHPSPFDFQPSGLLRFVLSLDPASQLNEIIAENWILKCIRAGRLTTSRHRPGYYTFV